LRIQRGADSADAQAADTGTRVRPDTWIAPDAWTPDAWTPDIHATRWTDVRTADSGGGQSDERRGWRPDILNGYDDGDRRLGGQAGRPSWAVNLARVAASAALGNP
jgi:hypothetical protein